MTKRILLAEDDLELQALFRRTLFGAGYSVEVTGDGDGLVKHIHLTLGTPEEPHLVLSDYHMPHRTGLSALRSIRSLRPHLPVILVTAYNDSRLFERAHSLGATACLFKPVDLLELQSVISRVLREERVSLLAPPLNCAALKV